MADVITRFKLETNQYDSALRDASQGLAKLTEQLTLAGNEFDKFSKKDVEVAKSLGQMESGATNLKDKLRDLVSAYNNVAKAYNNLTDEQKQTDFGKAMASSLEQLQQRITTTKNELYSMTDSTKQTGDGIGALNNIFGASITKLAGWGTAIAGIKGAMDVAKDAFFRSEQNIDDWGRAVEGAKGAYNIFLDTLNNGNWSNFFTNLTTAINGAQDLYNALDRLGSIKSNNQAAIALVQAQIQQLRVLKQQGQDVDEQLKQAVQQLKALQSQSIDAGKAAGTTSMQQVIRNGINSISGGANVSDRSIQAAINGILEKGQSEFDKYRKTVEMFENWSKAQSTVATNYTSSSGQTVTSYSRQFDINKLTAEQQRQYKIAKAITEGETRIQEGIAIYAQAVQEGAQSAREEFRGNRYVMQGNGKGADGSNLNSPEKAQQKYEQAMANYNQALEQAALEVQSGTISTTDAKKKELAAAEALWKAIGDARQIYDTPELKAEQLKVADKVKSLGGSVTALIDEQKAAQEAARELTSAQKKLSDAEVKMADALKANDYKAYTAAYKQYTTQQTEVQRLQPSIPTMVFDVEARTESALDSLKEIKGVTLDDKTLTVTANTREALEALNNVEGISLSPKQLNIEAPDLKSAFSYTQNNMSAFIAKLNEQLANADLGSTLYKNLTAQLADAQMLANLMQVAVKNGIDIAQFDPQALFNKIFGENPGDYIQPEKWEEVRKQIEAIVGKPITIDVNTGQVNVSGKNEGVKTTGQKDSMSQLINNVHTMTRCLQDMGLEIPEGFQKVISSMNLVTTILQTIQSLTSVKSVTGGGGLFGMVGGLFGSIFGGFFAHGGIVPHAANGMIVPGNDHADRTLIAASSGELIMSLAQQNNLVGAMGQMLNVGQMQRTEATIESDQIRLVLANGAQAKGMTIGEYLGIGG